MQIRSSTGRGCAGGSPFGSTAVLAPLLIIVFAVALGACQGNTRENFARLTAEMQVDRVEGAGFSHLILRRAGRDRTVGAGGGILHVYIEGDGLPWRRRHQVSADPTPRRPLALALMARDPAEVLYLGRPCYFNDFADDRCEPGMWTHSRYSGEIVASMAAALERALGERRPRLVLIGYSGGAALALLLAQKLENVAAVVTVAGNLDVGAWTEYHRYSALSGSLDPVTLADLASVLEHIPQRHFAGSDDVQVPPALTAAAAAEWGYPLIVIEGFDHRCCWVDVWPDLLGQIR